MALITETQVINKPGNVLNVNVTNVVAGPTLHGVTTPISGFGSNTTLFVGTTGELTVHYISIYSDYSVPVTIQIKKGGSVVATFYAAPGATNIFLGLKDTLVSSSYSIVTSTTSSTSVGQSAISVGYSIV